MNIKRSGDWGGRPGSRMVGGGLSCGDMDPPLELDPSRTRLFLILLPFTLGGAVAGAFLQPFSHQPPWLVLQWATPLLVIGLALFAWRARIEKHGVAEFSGMVQGPGKPTMLRVTRQVVYAPFRTEWVRSWLQWPFPHLRIRGGSRAVYASSMYFAMRDLRELQNRCSRRRNESIGAGKTQ